MQRNDFDVIIIGGGFMGLATSLFLARGGKKVCIIERDTTARHASGVNAGGVRVMNRHFAELPISIESQRMWRHMESLVGCDCGYRSSGMMCALETEAELADINKRQATLKELGYHFEELVGQERLREIVPAIAPKFIAGVYSKGDGFALPYKACKAFHVSTKAAGTTIHEHCRVVGIERESGTFRVRVDNGSIFTAPQLLNSAGAWGAEISAMAGDPIPLVRKAISMTVTARMPRFITPVVSGLHRGLSFKQMENGTVVIGGARPALVHPSSGDENYDDTRMDTLEMCDSVATAADYFPIMNTATVVRWWAGFEGYMPDKLPVVGASQAVQGLYHNCGYTTHGFQLAPMMGKTLAELMLGKTPQLSLDAFSPARESLQKNLENQGKAVKSSWN